MNNASYFYYKRITIIKTSKKVYKNKADRIFIDRDE